MKIVSFIQNGMIKLGVRTERGILNVTDSLSGHPIAGVPASVDALLVDDPLPKQRLVDYVSGIGEDGILVDEATLAYAPAVPRPNKIIGVGLNYWGYLRDSDTPRPDFPRLFSKFPESTVATGGPVILPANARHVDYEGELAVVIGKTGRLIPVESAMDHVYGYTVTNDVTCRDFQELTPSWVPGKCCDSFAPLGPWIVTADEIADPNDLHLKTWINGELRQNTSTSDMIVKVPEIISGISRFFTLRAGDVILTGSPEGIIICYPEAEREDLWLKPGDVMEVEIEGIGRLVNVCAREAE